MKIIEIRTMDAELLTKYRKSVLLKNKLSSCVFFNARHFENHFDARIDFWTSVRTKFPELMEYDATVDADGVLVFTDRFERLGKEKP